MFVPVSSGALCGPASLLVGGPVFGAPLTCLGLGVGTHRHFLSQMPRRREASQNRRNQNPSSYGTGRPPCACHQPCCHRLPPPWPPWWPHQPLSTLFPGSLAPSLRCPARRSVALGGAASNPPLRSTPVMPGPTAVVPRTFSAGSSR